MKKTLAVFIICLLFIIFALLEYPRGSAYKVLEVIEGDKFYIDFNADGKKDKDELIHLKGVNTFPLSFGQKAEECAAKYNITPAEAVSLGHLAKEFAKENLEGKNIEFIRPVGPYNHTYQYRFAEVKFFKTLPGTDKTGRGENFGVILLREGLGFAYESKQDKVFNPYKTFENAKKIRKMAHFAWETMPKNSIRPAAGNKKIYANTGKKPVPYVLSPQKTFGPVTVFLINPNAFNKPSFSCRAAACRELLKCINEAKSDINFALYGIEGQDEIFAALSRAKERGVKIRGVVDIKSDNTYVYKDTAKLKGLYGAVDDNKAQLMHNKFFIFDNKKVFTGTMNLSASGSGGYNSNTVIILEDISAAGVFKKEFEQMYLGAFQGSKTDNSAPFIINNAKWRLSIFFSPKGNAYEKGILPLIENAKKEIFISIFYLTHRGLINALKEAKARGADVKIIYDASAANNMKDRLKTLREAGIKVKVENWGGKNHQKDMVIDGKYFITGSANFSNSGMNYNDENILIFENKEIAGFYREHFVKLYNSLDDKYLDLTPRAESFESVNSCYDGIDNNFDGKTDSEDIGCKADTGTNNTSYKPKG